MRFIASDAVMDIGRREALGTDGGESLGKMLDAHDEGVWYGESQKLVEKYMAPEFRK